MINSNTLKFFLDKFLKNSDFDDENIEINTIVYDFQKHFPKSKISNLSIDDYVLGRGSKNSYCYWLEYETTVAGSIKGGSSLKHELYYSNKNNAYEIASRLNTNNPNEALKKILDNILDLIRLGNTQNWNLIEHINATDTLKYKTLFLYFPKLYMPIYSSIHYEYFIKKLGLTSDKSNSISSEQQILIDFKNKNNDLKDISMIQYTLFLYYLFGTPKRVKDNSKDIIIKGGVLNTQENKVAYKYKNICPLVTMKKTTSNNKKFGKRDYESIHHQNNNIGSKGELIAIEYEKNRLKKLIKNKEIIVNHCSNNDDGLGYDISSIEPDGSIRYIEVKTTKDRIENEFSFFLSKKELSISKSKKNYWIYIISDVYSGTPVVMKITNINKYLKIEDYKFKASFKFKDH